MTKDGNNARKQAARELAAAEQIPYTEALRRVTGVSRAVPAETRPPVVRVTVPVPAITASATLLGHTSTIGGLAFSPDGRTLASGGDITARIWNVADGQSISALTQEAGVRTIALSPDGRALAVGGVDGTVAVWTIASGQISVLTGDDGMVEWVGFTADSRNVIAGYSGRRDSERRRVPLPNGGFTLQPQSLPEVRLWDTATGQTRLICRGRALALHASGPGGVLAGADSETVWLRSLDGESRGELRGHTSLVETASFSPDGRTLATGAADRLVRVWDLATGETTAVLNPHGGYVTAVAFSPDGRTLATGTRDGVARLWDTTTAQHTATLLGHTEVIHALAFSPDGHTLATGSMDATIRLWPVT